MKVNTNITDAVGAVQQKQLQQVCTGNTNANTINENNDNIMVILPNVTQENFPLLCVRVHVRRRYCSVCKYHDYCGYSDDYFVFPCS